MKTAGAWARLAGALWGLWLAGAGLVWAQGASGAAELKSQDKRVLLLIAREAVAAALENRPSREARVGSGLQAARPLVVSLYVDGQPRARAWKLKNPRPLYLEARDLVAAALAQPKISDRPLTPEELARAKVGLAVLGRYTQAKDETEVPPRAAVIVYHGFTEWLALPGDVDSGRAADLLSHACGQAGLRPQVWLLPSTVIFSAPADEIRE